MSNLKVRLGTAASGWLQVELSMGSQLVSANASYAPRDSVSDLAVALLDLVSVDAASVRVVTLALEPRELDLVFARQEELITLTVSERVDHRHGIGVQKRLEVSGSVGSVLVPFWRALRDLESRQQREAYESNWRHPFPNEALAALSAKLKQATRAGAA